MKHKHVIFTAFILITTTLYAQQERNTAMLGIKGGINFTNLNADNVDDENIKIGFNLGLFAKAPITDMFSIQPELLYSSKGSKLTYRNFLQGEGEYRFNLNYLELPVLAMVNLSEYFNIHAGPYLGFLTSSNIKDLNDNGTVSGIRDIDVDNFNRFDYGFAFGLGVEIKGLVAGARYTLGLNEVGKSGNLTGDLTNNATNGVGSIYIGFGFY